MGSYDTPGHRDPIPGNPGFQSHDSAMTAPGTASPGAGDTDSAGASLQAGTVGNSALITPYGGSLVNADRVEVSPQDALVSTQADSYGPNRDPLTGIGSDLGTTGAGMGEHDRQAPEQHRAAMSEQEWQAGYQAGRERAEAVLARIPVPQANPTHGSDSGDPYRGVTDAAELQQVINQQRARAQTLVRVAEVTRPGTAEADSFDREVAYRRNWMRTVGRPFSPQELRGAPVAGCAACERLSGQPCEEHQRRIGDPIPLPPRPWPSEAQGHYPGTVHLPPYNLENSVA